MRTEALGLVVLLVSACTVAEDAEEVSFTFTTMEQDVHDRVNAHRQSIGLEPLEADPAIGVESRAHSENMLAGTVDFGHDGFDGRVERIGESIEWMSTGENVATNQGFADPAATAVEGWLDSPPHRENIEGEFNLAGVGIAEGTDGLFYFTQIFALTN